MNLAEHLPAWMHRIGPGELAIWQWLALGIALVAGYIVGRLLAALLTRLVLAMSRRTATTFDDELLAKLRSPLRALLTLAAVRVLLPVIELPAAAHAVTRSVLLACAGIALVWAAIRAIDVLVAHILTASWAVSRPTSRALLSLVGRIAKVIVVAIAAIGFLSALGMPVASLLAGLGIGGIALAFGAQKTVENLFGAVAIGVDQPLREGDFVKIEDDVLGTVETVGLRSTRIRTLDRTLVTLPNGKLADMKVESYAARDRCRLATTVRLTYDTSTANMRTVLAGLEQVLRAHPSLWPDDVVVRFVSLSSSSLDIEVMAWLLTPDWGQFRTWRQEILLSFMEVVEGAGAQFAFPTQTIHLERAA